MEQRYRLYQRLICNADLLQIRAFLPSINITAFQCSSRTLQRYPSLRTMALIRGYRAIHQVHLKTKKRSSQIRHQTNRQALRQRRHYPIISATVVVSSRKFCFLNDEPRLSYSESLGSNGDRLRYWQTAVFFALGASNEKDQQTVATFGGHVCQRIPYLNRNH